MKRLLLFGSIALLCFGVFCFYNVQHGDKDRIKIAIFTPTTHLALEEIEQGFKDTVQKGSGNYRFTTFNANGNRTLLRAQAEEIVQGDYDIIFTIGAFCSQTITELLSKRGLKTVHIFAGVDGPEFAHSLAKENGSSTGVYVKVDYKKELDQLLHYKPEAKNVLLVYDPTHGTGLEKDKQEIEEYLNKVGITLHPVEIYQTNEIQQKVAASLSNIDVLLVLIDNTVVAGIDALVVLCNRYGVTLFASDLSSGKKGAALAYGITEYDSGVGAGKLARAILEQGKQPYELPITPITNFRLELNKETMHAQRVSPVDTKLEGDHV